MEKEIALYIKTNCLVFSYFGRWNNMKIQLRKYSEDEKDI